MARRQGGGRVTLRGVELVDLFHGICMPDLHGAVPTDTHEIARHAIMCDVDDVILV